MEDQVVGPTTSSKDDATRVERDEMADEREARNTVKTDSSTLL